MIEETRRRPRKRCRIKAKLRSGQVECGAYVVDFTAIGLRVLPETAVAIWDGDPVEIDTEEFGPLKGTAKWRTPYRIGIELHLNPETSAKVEAYWNERGV